MNEIIPVYRLTAIEKKIRVLLRTELIFLNKDIIEQWFDEALEYLKQNEDYERMATIQDAHIRYHLQLELKSLSKSVRF